MLHTPDQGTCTAFTTRLARLRWLKAIDCLAQEQRQRAAPHPLWSCEKVGVAQTIAGYVLAQQTNRPLVTEQIPTHRVIVAERLDIYNG